jgi:glycosyltransferase involved in cell wall biosynthesis
MLIEAAIRFQDDDNLYWVFAGNGPLWDKINEQVKRYKLDRVIMPGLISREEIGRLFASSDLLLLPSTYESYGVVIQEAMMFGCSCIVSDVVGSGHDLLKNNQVGKIFSTGDMVAFENAIAEMIEVIRTDRSLPFRVQQVVAELSVQKTVAGVLAALNAVHVN